MPLMKKASKKAFEHNVRAEMHAGKPQPQSLAIAYSVQRKARKKKASGGAVESGSPDMDMAEGGGIGYPTKNQQEKHNKKLERRKQQGPRPFQDRPLSEYAEGGEINAKNERRPMPDNTYDDTKMASQNRHTRSNGEDGWTDNPTVRQAQSNNGRKVMPIKRPKMVPTDAFSTKLYDEEGDLQDSSSPGPYDEKPAEWHDEDGPDRQGPGVRDMEDEHSTHRKPYAKGGEVESSDYEARSNRYMDDLTDLPPSEDEADSMAMSNNETDPDRQGPDNIDMEDQHSSGRKPYARGGHIQFDDAEDYDHDEEMNPAHGHYSADDSEHRPDKEADMEDEDSIAAAIMSKEKRPTQHSDSDMDRMAMMADGGDPEDSDMYMYAEGGEMLDHGDDDILSHDSIYSDDSDQVDLPRNAEEDANEEDQLSWNALRKENYNTSYWDTHQPESNASTYDREEMNSHDRYDMADEIRRRMKSKRQFKDR